MKVRSVGLAALGSVLLVAAAGLGALLVHDGETASTALAAAEAGDDVAVKGIPQPFAPTSPLARWQMVLPLLGNHTYAIEDGPHALALLASATPLPAGVVLAEGVVAFVGPHPDGSGRALVVVSVDAWREPLLFR